MLKTNIIDIFGYLDEIFMAVLGLSSAISLVFVFREIIFGKELKDIIKIRRLYKTLVKLHYLKENSSLIKKRTFLNNIVNNGSHPCDLQQDILIDDSYLSVNSSMFINFGVNKDE